MNPDLLRQRRNLIAISAVLLVFDFARVKITKVSILGTELLVGDARVLMLCAWLLWAYFLLRYYQYWRAEKERHIRASFRSRMSAHARSYTKAMAVQDSVGQVYDHYRIVRNGLLRWSHVLEGYNPVEGRVEAGPASHLPAWRMGWWTLRSAASVAIHTPHATDHVLPFALGIAAPIVTLCTRWQLW